MAAKWIDPAFEPKEYERWPEGWYQGGFIAQYPNFKGDKMFKTEDTPETDDQGNSYRKITACAVLLKVNNEGFRTTETGNYNWGIFYRPEDLTEENHARIKDKLKKYKGRLPKGDPDWGGFFMFQSFGQLETIMGDIPMNGNGAELESLIGKTADFRLELSKPNTAGKQYLNIKQVAPAGSHVDEKTGLPLKK